MTTRQSLRIRTSAFICLALMVAACSPRAAAPLQSVQSANPNIKASKGVIAVARPVPLGGAQASIEVGVNGVLAALRQPLTPPSSVNATEFVIQRSDDTTAAMVVPVAPPAYDFSAGEQVEIIDGAEPALVPAN